MIESARSKLTGAQKSIYEDLSQVFIGSPVMVRLTMTLISSKGLSFVWIPDRAFENDRLLEVFGNNFYGASCGELT